MTMRRRSVALALAAALATPLGWAEAGTSYPGKPVTFIVPFGAGSATDTLARALADSLTEQTRQAVVVENRPGASGMPAAQYAARAAADGYTVLITTNTTQSANQHLYKKMPYDPVKDFRPVTALGRGGQVLVVRADSPYRSVADLVTKARKEPGKVMYGSGNSSSRVAGEMFKQLSQTDMVWIPYKSNPNAITDLLGGQIDFMVADTVTGLPQIQSGKLRALGVSTAKRLRLLPEVPTVDEAGVKGYDIGYWWGAYVPAATPTAVVSRLHELLQNAARSAQAKTFFEGTGNEAWTTTPEELGRFQLQEAEKWGRVIKAAGIEPE